MKIIKIFYKINKFFGGKKYFYNIFLSCIDIFLKIKQKYFQNNRVWIDCQGENPADRENIGPLIYHPTNGISKNYFPYENQEGYLSPAIFVEFTQPKRELNASCPLKFYCLSSSVSF